MNNIFKFDPETGAIIGLTEEGKTLTKIVIPTEIDGVAVTEIGWGAFYNCTSLKEIVIPDSVRIINQNAFENCNSLASVIIRGA